MVFALAVVLFFNSVALFKATNWSDRWVEINVYVDVPVLLVGCVLVLNWPESEWITQPNEWALRAWILALFALAVGGVVVALNPPLGTTVLQQGAVNLAVFIPMGASILAAVRGLFVEEGGDGAASGGEGLTSTRRSRGHGAS